MKLLFVAPYIYAPEFEEHSKNKSGFGIMVYDIANAVSKQGNEVVFATRAFGPKRQAEHFSIAKNSLFANVIHGKYRGIVGFYKKLKSFGASKKEILHNIYYYLNVGYIANLVKTEKPDVVHIHGCTEVTQYLIAMLQKRGVPYVVTLHGMLQDDTAGGTSFQKHCEIELIRNGYEQEIPITVISSRMKEMCLSDYYGAEQADNIHVVTNGIPVDNKETTYSVHEKYGIPADKKIVLTVGSLCAVKNQRQIIRAFAKMPEEVKEESVLLFVGTASQKYSVQEEIEKAVLQDRVICTGFVPREELHNYYAEAYTTVTASIVEGFGLSMAEGFVCGTPCVAFADLAAIPDLYDESAMLLCSERSDKALAETICQALNKGWDKNKIIGHGKKFSLETMAEKYQKIYDRLIKNEQ